MASKASASAGRRAISPRCDTERTTKAAKTKSKGRKKTGDIKSEVDRKPGHQDSGDLNEALKSVMEDEGEVPEIDCLESSPVIPPGKHDQCDLPPNCNQNNIALDELQNIVDQKFHLLDLGDRVCRDTSKFVGCGSYGFVYEGTLNPEQIRVAVKTVRCGSDAKDALKGLLREVYIWAKLKHKNVIKLLGITTAFDRTLSVVSPLMFKGNAFDYVQNRDVDPRPLILGIANGLHYLHTYERPIIHGDIKGPNVLVSNEGHALLTDFGFSHLAGASFNLAAEQFPGGTLRWMAPEYLDVMDEVKMTTAGDVWAFGMTTLELFTRKHPFSDLKNYGAILRHILLKERKRPGASASLSRLTDEWWNICLLCLNRDPFQRASMSNVIENIRALQVVLTPGTYPSTTFSGSSLPDQSRAARPLCALGEFSRRASRYSVNLDGRVAIDNDIWLRRGHVVVRSGMLSEEENAATVTAADSGDGGTIKETKVAIATPRGGPPGGMKAVKRVLREAHLWSKLDHPNVLPFLGITTEFDLTVSIVTPWMERGNAHDYVQNRAIDPRSLVLGIAQGLRYLHSHPLGPIIHGKVKGSNVGISDDGRALLYDFGFSLLQNSSFSMSVSGPYGGTINWMAPEMLDGGNVSAETDVWAFGMTTLELFTREIPFHDIRSIMGFFVRIPEGPPFRPSGDKTCSRMTDPWWDMCLSCWKYSPSLRPTISEIVETIEKTLDSNPRKHIGTAMKAVEEFSKMMSSYDFILDAQINCDGTESHHEHRDTTFRGRLRHIEMKGSMADMPSSWPPEETLVAVKVIHGLPLDLDVIKQNIERLRALSKLYHENILPLLGVTTNFDSKISVVSGWMERGNARQYVQNGDVHPGSILLGTAVGLRYLHTQLLCPIFHGILKGSNIMISPSGQALLTDFGLSDLIYYPSFMDRAGPINWTPPECFYDPKQSPAGDVWAFGMTILELFTREDPFDSICGKEELKRRITQGPAPTRPSDDTTRQRLTDGWWNLCLICWSRAPSKRPSIDKVLAIVEDELIAAVLRNDRNKMWQFLMQST